MRGVPIPAPIRELAWRLLVPLILLMSFGAAVLYSASGGR